MQRNKQVARRVRFKKSKISEKQVKFNKDDAKLLWQKLFSLSIQEDTQGFFIKVGDKKYYDNLDYPFDKVFKVQISYSDLKTYCIGALAKNIYIDLIKKERESWCTFFFPGLTICHKGIFLDFGDWTGIKGTKEVVEGQWLPWGKYCTIAENYLKEKGYKLYTKDDVELEIGIFIPIDKNWTIRKAKNYVLNLFKDFTPKIKEIEKEVKEVLDKY